MLFNFFLLEIPDRETTHLPNRQKLSQLDFIGLSMLLPGTICLLLAMQWGGVTYHWGDGRIIVLLTLAGVLLVGFVAVQVLMPDTATVPPRIFAQRSIAAGIWSTFCIGGSMMIMVYYLPIWFQAIKGVNAVNSGIRLLPMVLPMVIGSVLSGVLTSRVGYYTPFMLFGVVLLSIGAGLLTTLQVGTGEPRWLGYQVLYGLGMGMTFQAPNLAAQTVLPTRDVPVGTSLMLFSQLLSGAVFVSAGQNVLDNELLRRLARVVPGFDASAIADSGATSLTSLPGPLRSAVLAAYNEALRRVFRVGLALTCLTILGASALEWRSVKSKMPVGSRGGGPGKVEEGVVVSSTEAEAGGATASAAAATGSVVDGEVGMEGHGEKRRSVDSDKKDTGNETGNDTGEDAAIGSGRDKEVDVPAPSQQND